jgi:hypothetical protein
LLLVLAAVVGCKIVNRCGTSAVIIIAVAKEDFARKVVVIVASGGDMLAKDDEGDFSAVDVMGNNRLVVFGKQFQRLLFSCKG